MAAAGPAACHAPLLIEGAGRGTSSPGVAAVLQYACPLPPHGEGRGLAAEGKPGWDSVWACCVAVATGCRGSGPQSGGNWAGVAGKGSGNETYPSDEGAGGNGSVTCGGDGAELAGNGREIASSFVPGIDRETSCVCARGNENGTSAVSAEESGTGIVSSYARAIGKEIFDDVARVIGSGTSCV